MSKGIRIFEKEITTRENKYPAFKAGDTISILCEYEDGSKKQQQIFEGIVIQRRHPNTNGCVERLHREKMLSKHKMKLLIASLKIVPKKYFLI